MSTQAGWDRYSTSQEYQSGEYVFEEGHPADHVCVVSSGRVVIVKDARTDAQLVLGYVGPGELLGEISMLTSERRTASAIAAEPLKLLSFSRDSFWKLVDEDWAFRQLLINELVKHILAADRSRVDGATAERALSALIELRQATARFIVHDLQNPLSVISMALSMLESEPGYDPQSETAVYIDGAKQSVARMLVLVESLLDVERLDSATATLDLAPLDMVSLAEEVVVRSQGIAQSKEIALIMAQPGGAIPVVKADRQRIDRVLTNLIDNALKFTPAGGQVSVDFHWEADSMIVGVTDTGPGIPQEQREHIFERFVQAESGQKVRRGFGLGLAYCQSAVRLHGGSIWVEDGPGHAGSRFVFTLPLSASPG